MPVSDSNDELDRIRAAAAAGREIEAIKRYRAATGAGLAEAKAAVEALEAGRPIGEVAVGDVDAIQAALFAGNKIKAIKLHREATGGGLKESKDFIEALDAELRRTNPTRFVPAAANSWGAIIFFILIGIVIAALVSWIGQQ